MRVKGQERGQEGLIHELTSLLAEARGEIRNLLREIEAREQWELWLAERVHYLETREEET